MYGVSLDCCCMCINEGLRGVLGWIGNVFGRIWFIVWVVWFESYIDKVCVF